MAFSLIKAFLLIRQNFRRPQIMVISLQPNLQITYLWFFILLSTLTLLWFVVHHCKNNLSSLHILCITAR